MLRTESSPIFISGFTFVRNGIKLGYPFLEAIQSLLPLCDELIVNVAASEDGTLAAVEAIGDPKIRIIQSPWNEANRRGGAELALQTNRALDECRGRWCFYLQADELLHEKDLLTIRSALERFDDHPDVEGLLFRYIHFYGSFSTCFTKPGRFYRHEIRAVKNHIGVRSHGDAQGFRCWGNKLRVAEVDADIYHYGWARPPEVMAFKQADLDRLWHGDQWLEENPRKAKTIFAAVEGLEDFAGTHPAPMVQRAVSQNWAFNPPKKARMPGGIAGLRIRTRRALKQHGIGEYRNFKLLRPKAPKPIPTPKRICLIRIRSIGDTLLTTTAFRELKKAFPNSHLTLVIEPKCLDVVRNNPHIDDIILYERGWRSAMTLWKLLTRHYDVTIDFLGNVRSALATICAGGNARIGLRERWRKLAYTHRVLGRCYGYVGLQNLEFLRVLGLRTQNAAIEVFPSKDHEVAAKEFFRREGLNANTTVALFPTASWITKHWGDENYIALGRQITRELDRQVLVFWGPAEQERGTRIIAGIGSSARAIPQSGFLEAAALFKNCCLGVGNDSAFAHLAMASGIPTITIFGPTRESCWNPPHDPNHVVISASTACRPCDKQSCASQDCMQAIPPQDVYGAITSMLAKGVLHVPGI